MVFLDGSGFQNVTGAWRVQIVFDNLIHQGAMPPTIAIFIDPGGCRRPLPISRTASTEATNATPWATASRDF